MSKRAWKVTFCWEERFGAYDSPERKSFPEGHKDTGYWTTIYTSPMLPTYNRKPVSTREILKQYSDLLEAKWKGKLGSDPREVEWYANLKKIWGADRTKKFIVGLTTQDQIKNVRIVPSELRRLGKPIKKHSPN